jgi:hypothetical protein
MPRELHNAEQFQKLMPKALELRVVREKESVKLKLRTSDYLYTFKTNEDEAVRIVKNAKELEVIEINPKKEKESKEEKKSD